MLAKFKSHIEQQLPFLMHSKLLLAVSGGIDSMVLVSLCKQLHLDIGIAHCNFKLREEASDQDALFVKSIANKLKVPFHEISFQTEHFAKKNKVSIQMAARELRYQWFNELTSLHDYQYILTAHHLDDNIETFLINLLRGTGLQGLTGIPEQNANVIRPLLPFSREAIADYAADQKITWREDASNAETKYVRNKLRLSVIPILKTLNPELYASFSKTLHYLKGSQDIVKSALSSISNEVISLEGDGVKKINIERLKEHQLFDVYLIEILRPYGFSAWEDIVALLEAQSGKQIHSDSHRLIKDRAYLLLEEKNTNSLPDKVFHVFQRTTQLQEPIHLAFEDATSANYNDENTVFLDKDVLKFPLQLRKWKKGDYFYPLGMLGKKKLSKFFKDEKMSILAKESQWLLCSDDRIVWVVGRRIDKRFRITEQTKTIFKIKYKPDSK